MSRLSIRPRPLDIHKKLPIVKSFKEFEDDEAPRSSQLLRVIAEADSEVPQASSKKNSQEIPTPQFSVVGTYERDYTRTFAQPTSYIRGRGARAEINEFVEYDLDNEDEEWLEEFNNERKNLAAEKLETMLFKMEILDHKARERAGIIAPTFGSPIPVLLQIDVAMEALQSLSLRSAVVQAVYDYWKSKREQWQKPILRHLQPPPPVNDTNPYNVFRPREKAHRLQTRRMQRRENNVLSFEKLRLVRRNLDQAKTLLETLINREEKKREAMECDVNLQRLQMKYKDEAQLVEDGLAFSSFQQISSKFGSSEDDYADSDDTINCRTYPRPISTHLPPLRIKRRRPASNGWPHKMDLEEPGLLFTRPLDPEKLATVGIKPPPASPIVNGSAAVYRFHGRIGRGGRIIFDRCNPLLRASSSYQMSPSIHRPDPPNG